MKFQPSPRSYYSFNISGKRPRGRLVLERRARDPFRRAACAMKNSSFFPLPSRNRKGTRSRIFGFQNDFSHWTIFKAYSDFLAPAEFSTSPSHVPRFRRSKLDGPGRNSYPTDGVVEGKMDYPEIWYRSKTTVAASFCQISSFSPFRKKNYTALYSLPCSPRLRRAEADPCEEKELEWYDESLVNSHPRDDSLKTWSDFHVF